jgi:hypothetical protein
MVDLGCRLRDVSVECLGRLFFFVDDAGITRRILSIK